MRNGLGWLKLRSQWATLVRALSSSPRFPYTAYQINETADSPLESDLNRVFEYGYRYVIKSRESERLRVIERQNAEVQRLQREEAAAHDPTDRLFELLRDPSDNQVD